MRCLGQGTAWVPLPGPPRVAGREGVDFSQMWFLPAQRPASSGGQAGMEGEAPRQAQRDRRWLGYQGTRAPGWAVRVRAQGSGVTDASCRGAMEGAGIRGWRLPGLRQRPASEPCPGLGSACRGAASAADWTGHSLRSSATSGVHPPMVWAFASPGGLASRPLTDQLPPGHSPALAPE